MRRIKLDQQTAQVKRFVLSLPVDADGSILELKGEPVLRVLPVMEREQTVDKAKLKAAILNRRDESRCLNDEWGAADREGREMGASMDPNSPDPRTRGR